MSKHHCIPKTPIPQGVSDLVGSNHELLFTASYNSNEFGSDPASGSYFTVPLNVSVLPNSYSLAYIPSPFVLQQAQKPPNSPTFLPETYNFTTWSSDLKQQLGFIQSTNLYPNGNDFYTTLTYVQFAVAAKNGIYKCVSTVVIDYTQPVRVIYFFKKNHH
jgi:hypothetical protein